MDAGAGLEWELAEALSQAFELLLDRDFEFELALELAFDEEFGFNFEFGPERHFWPSSLLTAA